MQVKKSQSYPELAKNAALELIWPTRCAGCERLGALLCPVCDAALLRIAAEHACIRCGAPFGRIICTECYGQSGKEQHEFSAAVCAAELDELSGRVIVLYKDSNEHRLSSILADLILETLPEAWVAWAHLITWAPADKKALRRRGFDHMESIAEQVARRINIPAKKLLLKQKSVDQRTLNRSQRRSNLQDCLILAPEVENLPAHILLLDDVLTTGSTLDAASLALKQGGASEVRTACIARAW